jgi:hypothetical protein
MPANGDAVAADVPSRGVAVGRWPTRSCDGESSAGVNGAAPAGPMATFGPESGLSAGASPATVPNVEASPLAWSRTVAREGERPGVATRGPAATPARVGSPGSGRAGLRGATIVWAELVGPAESGAFRSGIGAPTPSRAGLASGGVGACGVAGCWAISAAGATGSAGACSAGAEVGCAAVASTGDTELTGSAGACSGGAGAGLSWAGDGSTAATGSWPAGLAGSAAAAGLA